MKEMIIKKEHLPKRCEICHQNDFFDAKLNRCLRCYTIEKMNKKETLVVFNGQNRQRPIFSGLMVIISGTLGGFTSCSLILIIFCFHKIITQHPFEMTYEFSALISILMGIYLGCPTGLITGLLIAVLKIKKWYINIVLSIFIGFLVVYVESSFDDHHAIMWFPIVTIIGLISGLCSTIAINKSNKLYKYF